MNCSCLIYRTEQISLLSFSLPIYWARGKDGWHVLSNTRQFNKEHQTAALQQQAGCGTLMRGSHTEAMSHSYQKGYATWSEWLSDEFMINRGRQQDSCGGMVICCCWTLQSSFSEASSPPFPFLSPPVAGTTQLLIQHHWIAAIRNSRSLKLATSLRFLTVSFNLTAGSAPGPGRNMPGISPFMSRKPD